MELLKNVTTDFYACIRYILDIPPIFIAIIISEEKIRGRNKSSIRLREYGANVCRNRFPKEKWNQRNALASKHDALNTLDVCRFGSRKFHVFFAIKIVYLGRLYENFERKEAPSD